MMHFAHEKKELSIEVKAPFYIDATDPDHEEG